MPPQDRVDHDLERHRIEERQGAREQPEGERAREVEPVRSCLQQQPAVEGGIAHHVPPSRDPLRAWVMVATPVVHCSSVRSAGRKAPRPRTAAATHA